MKIYHYTKGLHLKSIFKDGFVATEQKRNLNTTAPFFTDVVWLTESQTVPVTALPFIPFIPSTDLSIRQKIKNVKLELPRFNGQFCCSITTPSFDFVVGYYVVDW